MALIHAPYHRLTHGDILMRVMETALLWYILGLAALAIALAALLRVCRAPGWSILGGVIAGIILGPTLFGRMMPTLYEQTIVGGIEQREAIDQLLGRQEADRLVAREAGADEDDLTELEQSHREERVESQRELDAARWSHQSPQRTVMAGIVALVLLGAGVQRRLKAEVQSPLAAAMNIGSWAALLPGAIAGLCMFRWWGHTLSESLLVAAAVMIGPWMLTDVDREAADRAELGGARLIQLAGRIATVAALATILVTMLFAAHPERLVWALPLLGLIAGWFLPLPDHRLVHGVLRWILLPLLGAISASRIELIEDLAIWPLLIMVILSGDGRWVGAAIGTMLLGGRRVLRTMRLVMGSIACGPTQLAVLAVLTYTWVVPQGLALALLAGAVLIEASVPARRSMAQRLVETEETMREFDDEA